MSGTRYTTLPQWRSPLRWEARGQRQFGRQGVAALSHRFPDGSVASKFRNRKDEAGEGAEATGPADDRGEASEHHRPSTDNRNLLACAPRFPPAEGRKERKKPEPYWEANPGRPGKKKNP